MFESAELGHTIDKERFAADVPALREALLQAQFDLSESKRFPVVIVIGGVDGAGKGETVNLLNEWMDPRHIQTYAFGAASDEERSRPPMWRFWRSLPPRGKIGIFFGSWYTDPIIGRVTGAWKEGVFRRELEEIQRFEKMLADEGVLLLKFWFHLSKTAQKKRLKKLEGDARTRWRVTPQEWKNFKNYEGFRSVCEVALRETSTSWAPWLIVEGADARYRSLTVGQTLLGAMRARIDAPKVKALPTVAPPVAAPSLDGRTVLHAVDLSRKADPAAYGDQLEALQGRLNLLSRNPKFKRRTLLLVFEGADAAGKGGAIRRITGALDARHYSIVPIAAPTEEERAQPYLWRFWRRLPPRGHVGIFDRSWYGRVLVERVEGFCSDADWLRAYQEINDFEEQLALGRFIVCKFWLHLSKDEQLRRFEERAATGFKKFKITDEDWRNREKWDAYEGAVCDMVERTSTDLAPWTLISAEDKRAARLDVLQTVCARVEAAL
ncbi:MAG: polyphosphate:AMP phosphotransferase [Myxococcales bacterium]|nr:polyphosphate:AMP phosphotransferase [Myxococcales bacterium]